MKATTYTITGTKGKEIELPKQFSEEIRPDLIKQAVLVIQSRKRQQYGTDPRAGIEYSAKLSRRRKAYRGGYGRSASRIPRKVMLRRGTQFIYTGAVVSGTMGGRRAHPPKGEKIFAKSLNKKERQKAIRSAIAATIDKDYLENKGIKTTENLPLIVEKLEDVNKTKEIKALLEKLNLTPELERADNKGPLIVVSSNDSKVYKSGRNMPGFEITEVSSLNTELLAPGAEPGRLVIWSSNSIQRLEKENLFYSKNGSIQNDKISTSN